MKFLEVNSIPELFKVLEIVRPISSMYPNFEDWFWNKVVPGVINGEDKIIIGLKNGNIVGVSMLKNHGEKKLRALRVNDIYQKKGYGLYLIDKSLEILETEKPLVSVSEEMINDYSRIFINRYNFSMTHVYKGLYRKRILEYEFNGQEKLNKKSIYF